MRRVRVSVDRLRRYGADTRFEVFGDLGDGSVDFDHPLSPAPVAFWPLGGGRAGHLLDGHLALRHLDGVDPDGHVEGVHLFAEHLYPAAGVTYDSPAYVFGRFSHAVKMLDGAGNVSAASTIAVTVNSAPSVPECVTRSGYDVLTDVLTFSFAAVRFAPVAGS